MLLSGGKSEVKNKSFEVGKATCFACLRKSQGRQVKVFSIRERLSPNLYTMNEMIRPVFVLLPKTYSSDLVSCLDRREVPDFSRDFPVNCTFFPSRNPYSHLTLGSFFAVSGSCFSGTVRKSSNLPKRNKTREEWHMQITEHVRLSACAIPPLSCFFSANC